MIKKPTDNFYSFGLRGREAFIAPMDCPHQHLEIEIFFMEDGNFTRKFGNKVEEYTKKECAVFWGCIPHQLLSITPPGKGFIAYIPLSLLCRLELPQEFVHLILSGKCLRLTRTAEVEDSLDILRKTLPAPNEGKERVSKAEQLWIHGAIHRIAEASLKQSSEISAMVFTESSTRNNDKITQMIYYIVKHFEDPINASSICSYVKLNTTYGRSLFKKNVGVTIHDFLLNYRLERAKYYLANTNRVILDIANDCGFVSVSRFYAGFKDKVGLTPTQYRAKSIKI